MYTWLSGRLVRPFFSDFCGSAFCCFARFLLDVFWSVWMFDVLSSMKVICFHFLVWFSRSVHVLYIFVTMQVCMDLFLSCNLFLDSFIPCKLVFFFLLYWFNWDVSKQHPMQVNQGMCVMASWIMMRSFLLPFKLLWVWWKGSHDFDIATLMSLDPPSYVDFEW